MTEAEYFGKWLNILNGQELHRIMNILAIEYKKKPVCPKKELVFKAFHLCPYEEVRIIMLGQDPYPQKDVATGLLFGNQKGIAEELFSPSLRVIKESLSALKSFGPSQGFDPTLEPWAAQGILLLNSSLTVEMNKVGSHSTLWKSFISEFLQKMSMYSPGIIYLLFGKQAQFFERFIDNTCNTILMENHPAWYAREGINMPPTIFKQTNELIKKQYGNFLEWFQKY